MFHCTVFGLGLDMSSFLISERGGESVPAMVIRDDDVQIPIVNCSAFLDGPSDGKTWMCGGTGPGEPSYQGPPPAC